MCVCDFEGGFFAYICVVVCMVLCLCGCVLWALICVFFCGFVFVCFFNLCL